MTSTSDTPMEFAGYYPETEREKLTEIQALLYEWSREKFTSNFVVDGFYPYYYDQHPRVLFIGREAYGLAGCSYLEIFFRHYRDGKYGSSRLTASAFHRRIFYMMHAIAYGSREWNQVPNAVELAKDFASEGHTSFAFMNLNKESNETGRTKTRWNNLYAFVDKSRDYIRREIEILDPDIIITANLFDKLPTAIADVFPGHKYVQHFGRTHKDLAAYEWKINGHRVYIFDTFHWSAIKKEYQCYYACVREAYRKCVPAEKGSVDVYNTSVKTSPLHAMRTDKPQPR